MIRLLFNEVTGTAHFFNDGTDAERIPEWSRSGSATAVCSTAQFKEGTASLSLAGGTSDFIQTGAVAGRNFPVSGDMFAGGWFRPAFVTSVRFCGLEPGTTPALRGWIFVSNASNQIFFFYSDGTTTFQIGPGPALTVNTFAYLAVERVSNKLYFSVNGTIVNVGGTAFASNFNSPAGNFQLGATQASGAGCGGFIDMWQMRPASVFGGANFTPPTTPIP
jgi:hypothetical protein